MVNGQLFIIQDELNRNLFLKKETWRVSSLSTIKMEVKHFRLNGQMEKDAGLGKKSWDLPLISADVQLVTSAASPAEVLFLPLNGKRFFATL